MIILRHGTAPITYLTMPTNNRICFNDRSGTPPPRHMTNYNYKSLPRRRGRLFFINPLNFKRYEKNQLHEVAGDASQPRTDRDVPVPPNADPAVDEFAAEIHDF